MGVHSHEQIQRQPLLLKFVEEAEWAWWVMQNFKMVTGVVDSAIGNVAPRVTAARGPLVEQWSQRLFVALATFQWA